MNMGFGLMPLDGYQIVESSVLAGSKEAIGCGSTIFVSPAMWDLIKHADQAELERLLGAIRVRWLPANP